MVNITAIDNNEFSNFIHMKLREYNDMNFPHYKAYRKADAIKNINFMVEDNDKCIGGIIADVYRGWLNIEYLWIDEKYRGKGIGSSY